MTPSPPPPGTRDSARDGIATTGSAASVAASADNGSSGGETITAPATRDATAARKTVGSAARIAAATDGSPLARTASGTTTTTQARVTARWAAIAASPHPCGWTPPSNPRCHRHFWLSPTEWTPPRAANTGKLGAARCQYLPNSGARPERLAITTVAPAVKISGETACGARIRARVSTVTATAAGEAGQVKPTPVRRLLVAGTSWLHASAAARTCQLAAIATSPTPPIHQGPAAITPSSSALGTAPGSTPTTRTSGPRAAPAAAKVLAAASERARCSGIRHRRSAPSASPNTTADHWPVTITPATPSTSTAACRSGGVTASASASRGLASSSDIARPITD